MHELTHGMEHYMGIAAVVRSKKSFIHLQPKGLFVYSGPSDYMEAEWGGLWSADVALIRTLWDIIKEGYGDHIA